MPRSTRPIKSSPDGPKPGRKGVGTKPAGSRPGAPPKKGQTRQRLAEKGGPKGTPIRSTVEGVEPVRGVASKKTRSRKALAQGVPQYVPEKKRKPGESRHAISPGGPSVDSVAKGSRRKPAPIAGPAPRSPRSVTPRADVGKPTEPRPVRTAARGEKPSQQERLAYGRHPVSELLTQGQVERLFLQEGLQGDRFMVGLEREARARNIGVNWVNEGYFASRIGENPHQGVLAQVRPYPYATLDDVLTRARELKDLGQIGRATILLLDGLEDPGNLGGILRTAAGLGIAGVVLPGRRAAGVTAAVYKTSAGTVGRIPLARVANLRYALEELKAAGWWSVAATAQGDRLPAALPSDVPLVLVMGAEHSGISPQLEKECDFRVAIPLQHGVESLNVSAATAILLAGMVGLYR